nr:MAG TPA: hypothetical protein [Bacteriophage sp.]
MNRCSDRPRASAASRHRSFVPGAIRIFNSSIFDRYFFAALFWASVYFSAISVLLLPAGV